MPAFPYQLAFPEDVLSKPDERKIPLSEYPPQAIHDLRNCLGGAVGTADLALLDELVGVKSVGA